MARLACSGTKSDAALPRDERGVVYVEFLLAFFPLLLLFFSICQLALIASARLVVEHAAQAAVRSAIVILDESPEDFDGAPRGNLSKGRGTFLGSAEALLAVLGTGIQVPSGALSIDSLVGLLGGPTQSPDRPQAGARMGAIRTAAYFPLLPLAPRPTTLHGDDSQSLGDSLPDGFGRRLPFALEFSRAAAVVTVHDLPGAESLAVEPIQPKATITVRVTYLFHCAVPLARRLLCETLTSLLTPESSPFGRLVPASKKPALVRRLGLAEAPGALSELAGPAARFAVLTAEATLPNQGADYYQDDEEP